VEDHESFSKRRLSDLSGAEIKDNLSGASSSSRKAGANGGLVPPTHPSVITLGAPTVSRVGGIGSRVGGVGMSRAKGAGGINYSRINSSHQASVGDSIAAANGLPGAPGSDAGLVNNPQNNPQ